MPNPQPIDPRSAAVLVRLARLPRILLIGAVLALILGGLFAPGVIGALLLLAMAALVGWLTWLGRGHLQPAALFLRGIVVLAFVALAVQKVL